MQSSRLILPAFLVAALAAGWAIARPAEADGVGVAAARREAAQALDRAAGLEARARRAADDASRAQAQSLAIAERIGAAEAHISAAEARLRSLAAAQAVRRARLAEKEQPVVRLAAMLQTMARRPAALALVQPGSVEDVAHVRALLGATLPVVRQRTAALRKELESDTRLLEQVRAATGELARRRVELRAQQDALAALEQSQRQRSRMLSAFALTESDRALALGEDANELAAALATRGEQARISQALAALPGPVSRPGVAPAARPRLPLRYTLPVSGRLITGTGEISDAGVHARGLIFEAPAQALVAAPAGGRIAFAGGFRRYGEIVIIDHGGGWTSLITGLASTGVRVGETVRGSAPIGRAGQKGRPLGVELRFNGRPVPITPLLGQAVG